MAIIPEVLAHGVEEAVVAVGPTLDQVIRSNSIKYTIFALVILLILTITSLVIKQKSEWFKYLLFGGFIVVILANTIYLTSSTIYLNQKSETGGPVHWHGDFQIWNCGMEVELADPEGLSNKVGTSVVHEHNDKRIHIEGVVLEKHQASLGHFFEEVGGNLENDSLSIPATHGILTMETGAICPDGLPGVFQVFVFRTSNGTFSQQKLTNPESYIITPKSNVPPGDCIIFEFGPKKEKTDKLCKFYEVAIQKGELRER